MPTITKPGLRDWYSVLGKAINEGKFNRALAGVLTTSTPDEIRKWVKNNTGVRLTDADITWLKRKIPGSSRNFMDLIAAARTAGSLNGGSGRT